MRLFALGRLKQFVPVRGPVLAPPGVEWPQQWLSTDVELTPSTRLPFERARATHLVVNQDARAAVDLAAISPAEPDGRKLRV